MIKGICIVGSPNRHGSTSMLMEAISRGLSDTGAETQTFYLADMRIGPCRGCNACRETRRCTQRDDMDMLVEAFLNADIVCIGSPSWWGDVTSYLKAFIDRSLPLCDTLPGGTIVPPGKLGIAVAVRAGRSASESIKLIETIEHYFGHLGIKAAGRLHAEGISSPDDLAEREGILETAYRLGRDTPRLRERMDLE